MACLDWQESGWCLARKGITCTLIGIAASTQRNILNGVAGHMIVWSKSIGRNKCKVVVLSILTGAGFQGTIVALGAAKVLLVFDTSRKREKVGHCQCESIDLLGRKRICGGRKSIL